MFRMNSTVTRKIPTGDLWVDLNSKFGFPSGCFGALADYPDFVPRLHLVIRMAG